MRRVCRIALGLYVLACIVALVIIPLNAAGRFGMTPDPLVGVFAVLLSAPWIYPLDSLLGDGGLAWNMMLAVISITANAAILGFACSRLARR
ncbi:MAG: hypothetical protein VYD64_03180 [Pseudomonadota bacterium]|nr:hypothetical protein [Pseudomonadota bacterium]